MTIDVYVPTARGPTGPIHRTACRLADPELLQPVGTTGPRGERQVTQAEQICPARDVRARGPLADIQATACQDGVRP